MITNAHARAESSAREMIALITVSLGVRLDSCI